MVSQKTRKGYILYLLKHFSVLIILMLFCFIGFTQKITRHFSKDSASLKYNLDTNVNKNIPADFKEAIHLAFQFYNELNENHIIFRIKKMKSPLTTRPTYCGVFRKASKRKYIITISCSSTFRLDPILLHNLSFNSQVGVIGHELAHIKNFNSKRGFYFIVLALKHISKKSIDKFENDTDKLCIRQGLGYQLLSWSTEVREKLDLKQWGGSNNINGKEERYMNPISILNYMNTLPIYILN